MKWNHISQIKSVDTLPPAEIVTTLLKNRGLITKKAINAFLVPKPPETLEPKDVGINLKDFSKAVTRLKQAIKNDEPVAVYGDYDADGICATAIMWEALRELGAKVQPFIPLREKEGYGLSPDGISSIINSADYQIEENKGLIVAVDSGIVAFEAVDYARSRGLDIIILDHHEKGDRLPASHALIHTQELCASGIAWFVAKSLSSDRSRLHSWLELASIATVTDLMPLLGPNRSLVKTGLPLLNNTSRMGLRALYNLAGIQKVGTYEIGFMIGPRLNASGRIENALTALNLLCAIDFQDALRLAEVLNSTNRDRQQMTEEMTQHAVELHKTNSSNSNESIIVLENESYHQGIIGLIAGKLVERYYLPSIVISKGETLSKASARSITGFNIIEAIRETSDLLVASGGHPMAAGFTIETEKIEIFKKKIKDIAAARIAPDMLNRVLRVDLEVSLSDVTLDLYHEIKKFEPFGLGNPEPVFSTAVVVRNARTVGSDGKHLKLQVGTEAGDQRFADFDCIAFGKGILCPSLPIGQKINIAYNIDLNTYNGFSSLQLKIKDINI